jgi:peptidoglycan/xylan/chitin deacetylase (PgdA/CDA1 family)
MCLRCAAPMRLSRRSFNTSVLAAAAVDPSCLAAGASDEVVPRMRLVVPARSRRTMALTLDACDGEADHRIIQVLFAMNVPATIFVSGLWLRSNPHVFGLLRGRPDLFSLQNHGERHIPPVLGPRTVYGLAVAGTMEAVEHEVKYGADALVAAGGERPTWYRGAAAVYSPQALSAIEGMGFQIGGFSLSADLGASLPAAAVARRMEAAANGEVLLAHVNHPGRSSGAGVVAGVEALRAAGVTFVKLGTLPVVALPCGGHRHLTLEREAVV